VANQPDALDRQIISVLQGDGRMSNVEVARLLGVAEATVRKRLERLLDEGFIRIVAIAEPGHFGLSTQLFVGVEVDLAGIHGVAARLAEVPEIYSVKIVTGAYDIILEAYLPSGSDLLGFLVDKVAAIPGVKRTETCHIAAVPKRGCDWQVPSRRDAGSGGAGSGILPGSIVVPI
jgi:Lrp/AsnC family transcriptional regulator for asnA, asnC and gidA